MRHEDSLAASSTRTSIITSHGPSAGVRPTFWRGRVVGGGRGGEIHIRTGKDIIPPPPTHTHTITHTHKHTHMTRARAHTHTHARTHKAHAPISHRPPPLLDMQLNSSKDGRTKKQKYALLNKRANEKKNPLMTFPLKVRSANDWECRTPRRHAPHSCRCQKRRIRPSVRLADWLTASGTKQRRGQCNRLQLIYTHRMSLTRGHVIKCQLSSSEPSLTDHR